MLAGNVGLSDYMHPMTIDAEPERVARAARSVDVLEAAGVEINAGLPAIEAEGEVILGGPEEFARRAVSLPLVAGTGQDSRHAPMAANPS